jgi:hypothetical protein
MEEAKKKRVEGIITSLDRIYENLLYIKQEP